MVKKFILKFTVFSLPIGLFCCAIIGMGIWFGNLLPISQIIELQLTHNGIYRIDGSQEEIIHYKQQMALHSEVDFLVLGSSRFYFIRENVITNPDYQFYNASVPGLPPANALEMLETLANHNAMPEILLINFDLAWFNGNRSDIETFPDRVDAPDSFTEATRLLNTFQSLAHDLVINPQSTLGQLPQVRQTSTDYFLGHDRVDSGQLDRTFKADGSIIRVITATRASAGIEASRDHLANRLRIYETGTSVDEDGLAAIREMITLARESNTLIIGVLPPYHPDFYEQLQISSDYSYFNSARDSIARLFDDSGMIFHDFSNPDGIGIDANMFYDGWHLGEVGTLALYLNIVNANEAVLMPYSNPIELKILLENAASTYSLSASELQSSQ